MKRALSIGFVAILSLQYLYNLSVITYFQINRQFVANVLCINRNEPIKECHGQCFLKKNLDVDQQSLPDENSVPASKLNLDYPSFIVNESKVQMTVYRGTLDYKSIYIGNLLQGFASAPFHPPSARS